eukprot:176840-Rhodomonas_salina.1
MASFSALLRLSPSSVPCCSAPRLGQRKRFARPDLDLRRRRSALRSQRFPRRDSGSGGFVEEEVEREGGSLRLIAQHRHRPPAGPRPWTRQRARQTCPPRCPSQSQVAQRKVANQQGR